MILNANKKRSLSSTPPEPVYVTAGNLFIGNVGHYFSSESALAAQLNGIDAVDITNFVVDDRNNVSCTIGKNFTTVAFYNLKTDITFFIDLDGWNTGRAGNSNFRQSSIKFFYSPTSLINSTSASGRDFYLSNSLRIFYAPTETVYFGASAGYNSCLLLTNPNLEMYVNPALETSNGGAREAEIDYPIVTYGASVSYVSDFTLPSAITDLTLSSITSSGCTINFTPPASTNALHIYEVWVDGVFYDWINTSGESITGLPTSGRLYKITVFACDIYYNRSLVSNEATFTTS